MPNDMFNKLTIEADETLTKKILEGIKNDEVGTGSIDFNKIIPMPEELNITKGSYTDRCIDLYMSITNPQTDIFEGYEKLNSDEYTKLLNGFNQERMFLPIKGSLSNERIEKLLADEFSESPSPKEKDEKLKEMFSLGERAAANLKEYGATDWYEWSVKNWGSKWNSYNRGCPSDTKDNSIVFNTAWSPVYPLIKKLSEIYPEATFIYEHADEEVGAIVGRNVYKNGEITEQYLPENYSKEAYELMSEMTGERLTELGFVFDEELNTYRYDFENEEGDEMEL